MLLHVATDFFSLTSKVTRVRIKGPNTGDGLTGDEKAAILSIFADQFDEIKLTSHLLASAGVQELAYSLKHRSGPVSFYRMQKANNSLIFRRLHSCAYGGRALFAWL